MPSKSAPPMRIARLVAGNMSQTELAERLGVTQSLISRVEKGTTQPRIDLARKIAALLNTTVDELFPPASLRRGRRPVSEAVLDGVAP